MIQATSSVFFTMFYAMFVAGFLLQSREFIGAGLSPQNILSRWLQHTNSEEVQFVQHHIVRTSGTLILHCALPLIYLFGYSYFALVVDDTYSTVDQLMADLPPFFYSVIMATLLVISASSLVYYWSLDGWQNHPYAKRINGYTVNNRWNDVASDINNEFRRIDKFTIQTSPLNKVVVTDNWIIMVGQWPWKFNLAHQSDVQLELIKSEHHAISPEAQVGGCQYLSIRVKNRRSELPSFNFRLNSNEYRNLENKVRGSIVNIENISIFKSVSERFVEVFREHVEQNPRYTEAEEVENCIGCMAVPADVKLQRRCAVDTQNPCVTCYCRPMWCITCLGKWFAMRQDQEKPETWLGSKCPCPTCRSKFCIVDVSLIEGSRLVNQD